LTTDANGAKVLELRYKAWGEIRATWTSSPSTTPAYKMPLYQYTGQAAYLDDPLTSGVTEGFGLMFYNARWYDPYINHFVQADTITPRGAQGLDRYAAMNNNPVKYSDPSGHDPWWDDPSLNHTVANPVYGSTEQLHVDMVKQDPENTYCGQASYTMAYNYAHPSSPTTQDAVIKDAEDNDWHTEGYPFTSPANMEKMAGSYGNYQTGYVSSGAVGGDALKLIMGQIQSGNTVIVDYSTHPSNNAASIDPMDSHFVVVTGFSIDGSGNVSVTYNDPYSGEEVTKPWDIFSTTWLNNGDDGGAGNGWWLVVPTDTSEDDD
jgi:RHS repeat-associated protein